MMGFSFVENSYSFDTLFFLFGFLKVSLSVLWYSFLCLRIKIVVSI